MTRAPWKWTPRRQWATRVRNLAGLRVQILAYAQSVLKPAALRALEAALFHLESEQKKARPND